MKANYGAKVNQGSMSSWTATHNIAVEEAKLELFMRYKKDPKLDLFSEFEKLKHEH